MNRIEKFANLLDEQDIGAAVITSFENRFYLSGFYGSAGYLVISKNHAVLVTDSRYTIQAAQQTNGATLVSASETDYTPLAKFIAQSGITRLAFEDTKMTVSRYNELKERVCGAELVPIGEKLDEMRKLKDASEVLKICEAVRLADEAFSFVTPKLRIGMKETEVAALIEGYMRKNGAEKPSFDTICAAGERSALPHGTATDNIIKNGDFLVMDYGCVLDGYCSDITRTVAFGRLSDRQREIYGTVLKAQEMAMGALTAGVAASDVDFAARDIIAKASYGDNFGHSLGHGVGIEVHEAPMLSPKSRDILEAGNVITIEPGIYIEGFSGVRIEDMALITESGADTLTRSGKEWVL